MKTRTLRRLRFLMPLLLACVLASPTLEAYTSESGRFSCPNPLENTLGARMQEGNAFVSFMNDFGERYRVETIPLEPEAERHLKQYGRRPFLHSMMDGLYLPNTIFRAVPDAKRVHQAYLDDVRGGAVLVHVLMPQAGAEKTHYDLKADTKTTTRLDAVRAVLAFQEKDRVVFVSSELSSIRDEKTPKAVEDAKRKKRLSDQTVGFAKQVTIQ